ncbi:MAG: metal-dependent hydrolase, partial [Alphaproteobacteria bacterium]
MTKSYEPARLIARPVEFDWSDLPFYWVPDEPFASHAFNMNHLLLPAGEQWFCRVFQEAMPFVVDPVLRRDMALFLKQEANHARAHNEVVAYYQTQGIDVAPVINWIEDWWRKNLGPRFLGRELKSGWAKRQWLLYRLG